jgi:hypothetical protein
MGMAMIAPMKPSDTQVARFSGLNNVDDPLSLGLSWLTQADNVNITSADKLERRDGYTLDTAGDIKGAYATIDLQRMYYVDDVALKAYGGAVLDGISSSARMHWTEVNGDVFFNNGIDRGIIKPDNQVHAWEWPEPAAPVLSVVTGSLAPGKYDVLCTYLLPDGRETGAGQSASIQIEDGQALMISQIPQYAGHVTRTYIAPANSTVFQLAYEGFQTARRWDYSPNSLGLDLATDDFDPLPAGCTVIQAWKGRMYAAQYIPSSDMTAIWMSQPLGFHLFDLATDFLAISGEVLMLAPTDEALVIGTDKEIHGYTGEAIVKVAEYGVVPGFGWACDDEDPAKPVLMWTQRGLCKAMPFTNLTSGHVSVAPGVQAGAAVIAQGGQKRFVAVLHQGGTAFNSR